MHQKHPIIKKQFRRYKTLNELGKGEKSKIIAVRGHGSLRGHLLDMGLTPNTQVMVRKVAPMGDPIELTLRGYELTLRVDDAKNIDIEGTNDDSCISGKPELWEDNAIQSDNGRQSACRQFPGRHRRAKGRGCTRT